MANQMQLTPYTEVPEVSATQTRKLLVMANLKAPEMQLEDGKERAPISVSAVIDRSGSMQGSKIDLTKATLRFVISKLTEQDEFGIISYASDVSEALKLQKMDSSGRRLALHAVDKISADGCTNLSGGVFAGMDQLKGTLVTQQGFVQRDSSPSRHQVQRRHGTQQRVTPAATPGWPVPLLIGNECSMNDDSSPWKLFVRLADTVAGDIVRFVDSVEFSVLAEDGSTQAVTVAQVPFELSRSTRSTAEVQVHIKLVAAFGAATHVFRYTPNFLSPMTFITVNVSSAIEPPLIVTTPPSQAPAVEPPFKSHNDVAAVWLFTDGQANEGITVREDLVKQIEERQQGMEQPCSIFTFGFGDDHDAQMLKDVADAGKGMYYYVRNETAIAEAFADCLGGLFSVVARSLKLVAAPVLGVTVRRMFTKYDHRVSEDEAWVVIPDMYGEEERDILLEVEVGPVDPPNATPSPIIHWRLDYQNILTDQEETTSGCCMLARPADAGPCPPHPLLDQQRNRVRCTDAIQEARVLADDGKIAEAQKCLDDAMAAISDSSSGREVFCVGLVEDLRDCRAQLVTVNAYRSQGSKTMMNTASCHGYQRSCGMKNRYMNSAQTAMIQSYRDSAE